MPDNFDPEDDNPEVEDVDQEPEDDFEDEDVDSGDPIIESLVKQFGKQFREEITDSFTEEGRYGSWGEAGSFEADGVEYNWIKDVDEAERIALDITKQELEQSPEVYGSEFLESHVYITDTDRRLMAQEEADSEEQDMSDEDVWDYLGEEPPEEGGEEDEEEGEEPEEMAEFEGYELPEKIVPEQVDFLNRLKKESHKRYATPIDDARERLRERIADEWEEGLKDPIQFLCHDKGFYSVEDLLKQNFISINYDEAAQEIVDTDGWERVLSLYDGSYEETAEGVVYFRE